MQPGMEQEAPPILRDARVLKKRPRMHPLMRRALIRARKVEEVF